MIEFVEKEKKTVNTWVVYLKEQAKKKALDEKNTLLLIKDFLQSLLNDGWRDKQKILEHIIEGVEEELNEIRIREKK